MGNKIEFIIERKIVKRGISKIKLTEKELADAYYFYTNILKEEQLKYYKNMLVQHIKNNYCEGLYEFVLKDENQYLDYLAEICYENQDAINNVGISYVWDLATSEKHRKLYEKIKLYEKE